jgi:N-methylhydantoinase B
MSRGVTVDPISYEIFSHRLWAIGEEGRIALQRVTASPIVAQGGECMCSFYEADGTMILACSGHLRFAAATSDAIRQIIEWYENEPGIHDGDEFFFNDPYVAGSHTYDIMQIAPIFADGRRIAWVASSSHTADTGGVLRGAATEIYHEGIRILGLKIVDGGQFRADVFRTVVEQCRDPHYVGMDLKSRTAANNVCARGYRALVERFGVDFVVAAGRKLIDDAERMSRAKLRAIPDGTWRSRIYGSARDPAGSRALPYQVVCAATKMGDGLRLDFSGSSSQLASDQNSTLPSTVAHVAIALTNQLFWDVPWSDGKMRPVEIVVPQGTALNCRFPAACGRSPRIGQYVVEAVRECLSKMLFAAGTIEDVNASWGSFWYLGGPGFFYGGHNARGLPNPQGLYDIHGGGLGATPARDGVSTGGQANIPSGGISDVERIELQYPFLYFSRNHNPDGGGVGRHQGGNGSARLVLVRGSSDLSVDFTPYAGLPHGAFGLFGGYPVGTGGVRAILEPNPGLADRLAAGDYPTDVAAAVSGEWAVVSRGPERPGRTAVPEGHLIADFVQGGGGYGDPLEREPERVAADVESGLVRRATAERIYGIVFDGSDAADLDATASLREQLRRARLAVHAARPTAMGAGGTSGWSALRRIHDSIDLGVDGGAAGYRCRRCSASLGPATENYKRHALRSVRELETIADAPMPDGSGFLAVLHEYACPGCGALLQVDVYCQALGGEEDLWDIQPAR